MKSTYPDMENEGEMVDCEVDFVFRNLLDMSLTWNGQELIKFTNEMVGMDFRYTFYYMGYEAYSMSPMTWYNKVMDDIHQISKEGYLMYKENEHYQNQIMEIMSMESEEMQMAEIMNHIQFLGNWDYAASKMKVIFNEIMQNMKSEKCGKTLKEHAADYGYYMAEDGEMAVNKIQDRTGAETMIDAEFDMIMEKREGEWLEEFNYMWEENMKEEENMDEIEEEM